MRSRLIGGPGTSIVIDDSRTLSTEVDLWVVSASSPVVETLPLDPDDGDAFSVVDGLGNAAGQPIAIDANTDFPILGPNPASASIDTDFGGIAFMFSVFRKAWIAVQFGGGGGNAPFGIPIVAPAGATTDLLRAPIHTVYQDPSGGSAAQILFPTNPNPGDIVAVVADGPIVDTPPQAVSRGFPIGDPGNPGNYIPVTSGTAVAVLTTQGETVWWQFAGAKWRQLV